MSSPRLLVSSQQHKYVIRGCTIFRVANTDNLTAKALSAVVNAICCVCARLSIRFYVQRLMLCYSYFRTQVRIIYVLKDVFVLVHELKLRVTRCNRSNIYN
jgi:hypothetical protein